MTTKISEVNDPDECVHMMRELIDSAERTLIKPGAERDSVQESLSRAQSWHDRYVYLIESSDAKAR